jgi:heme A synthase
VEIFHLLLGRSVVFFTLICGVWGLLAHFGRLPSDGRYYSTLVLAELLVIAQALLGVILLVSGGWPRDPIHFLYGGLAALVLPVVYGTANRRGWSTALACGLASLFIFGLSIRAFTTTFVGFAGLFGAPR